MNMEPVNKIRILKVFVSSLTKLDLIEKVVKWSQQAQERSILYANAHTLNLAYRDLTFLSTLNAVDLVFADGISVVWAARFLYHERLEKLVCRVWVELFLARAAEEKIKIFILAGKPGVAETAAQVLQVKIPNLNVVGTHTGYFRPEEIAGIIQAINETRLQVVFIGMGSPFQELWLAKYREQISAPVCCAVGAYFDYHAGLEKSVPEWINRLGLEWFWRLILDPHGKWRRYVLGNPLFIFRVLEQKIMSITWWSVKH